MPTQPLDARERDEMCDLFLEVGPDAPTLCEGWSAADLAAHLVVRERSPLAAPGILVPALEGLTDKAMGKQKDRPWSDLVDRVRSGPPIGPFRVPGLRTVLNLPEYFVHHEDLRRANGLGPRTDRADLDRQLWSLVNRSGRLLARRAGQVRLVARRGDGSEIVLRDRGPEVVLSGQPGEIVLFLYGRKAAEVELSGDAGGVETVRGGSFGI